MFELDLHRLAVFYTVVNEGTLSKAGDSLYMSQPAISAHIKALEQQLGVPLFYRVGRRSVVNKAGEVLYKKAEQLFCVADELKAEMEELKGMYIGRLNLGASVDWQYMLPSTLDRFKQKYPGVEVSMGIASEDRIERLVLDRSLDFGFVGQASSRAEMVSELLASVSDLASESFVVREVESAARSVTDERLEDLELIGSITMELGSYEAIKSAIISGKGIGIVTRQSLDAEIKAGLLVALDVPQLTAILELHLIYLKQKKMTSTQSAFLDMACAHGAMASHLASEELVQVPRAS